MGWGQHRLSRLGGEYGMQSKKLKERGRALRETWKPSCSRLDEKKKKTSFSTFQGPSYTSLPLVSKRFLYILSTNPSLCWPEFKGILIFAGQRSAHSWLDIIKWNFSLLNKKQAWILLPRFMCVRNMTLFFYKTEFLFWEPLLKGWQKLSSLISNSRGCWVVIKRQGCRWWTLSSNHQH